MVYIQPNSKYLVRHCIVRIYIKLIGRYNLTWIWTISLMVARLAGAWSACIDWTLWSGSMVDEADHQCGQNGPHRESVEQSATKNIPHICHIITPAHFVNKTDQTKNL